MWAWKWTDLIHHDVSEHRVHHSLMKVMRRVVAQWPALNRRNGVPLTALKTSLSFGKTGDHVDLAFIVVFASLMNAHVR